MMTQPEPDNDTNPFFSIIMPIYNAEDFLEEAIQCIIKQTYRNFELILVNDGSTDACPKLCDIWRKKDTRIKTINKKNGGASSARNVGLSYATGSYVSFFDADDTYEPVLLEEVHQSICNYKADAVLYGFKEQYLRNESIIFENEVAYRACIINNASRLHDTILELERICILGYPWNKFYKMDRIRSLNLSFEKFRLLEDLFFNCHFFENADSLNIIDKCLYCYKKRNNQSLTNGSVPEYWEIHKLKIIRLKKLFVYWDRYDEEVKELLGNLYCRYGVSQICRDSIDAEKSISDRKKFIDDIYNDPLYKELMIYARSDRLLMKIIIFLFKAKQTALILVIGKTAGELKGRDMFLFNKLRNASFR